MKNFLETITFKCPWCGNFCAFRQTYAGKKARCTKCQQQFIIPGSDTEPAVKVEEAIESDGDITSGFYEAVKSVKPFFTNPKNMTGFVFITALTVFKFIFWNFNFNLSYFVVATGKVTTIPIMAGRILGIAAWGMIFKVYLDTIYYTAYDQEELPELEIGFGFDFILNITKPLYISLASMTAAQIPTLLLMLMMKLTDAWYTPVLWISFAICTFLFPMLILMAAVARNLLAVFRIDLAAASIKKVFPQYCICAALVYAAIAGNILSKNLTVSGIDPGLIIILTPVNLIIKILVTMLGLYAARTLGLLYRHYGGLMKW